MLLVELLAVVHYKSHNFLNHTLILVIFEAQDGAEPQDISALQLLRSLLHFALLVLVKHPNARPDTLLITDYLREAATVITLPVKQAFAIRVKSQITVQISFHAEILIRMCIVKIKVHIYYFLHYLITSFKCFVMSKPSASYSISSMSSISSHFRFKSLIKILLFSIII